MIDRGLSPYAMLRPSIRKIVMTLEAAEGRLAGPAPSSRAGTHGRGRWSLFGAIHRRGRGFWARICEWASRENR
jgi:hypothetical protein